MKEQVSDSPLPSGLSNYMVEKSVEHSEMGIGTQIIMQIPINKRHT